MGSLEWDRTGAKKRDVPTPEPEKMIGVRTYPLD